MTDPPQQTGSDRWRRALWALGLAALYLAATWLFLRPTLGELRQAVAPDVGDPVFNLYILEHGAQQWRTGFPAPWDAPFFFPAARTIILSDHLLGPALAFAGLVALLPGPIAAYNALLIAAFTLSGLAFAYVLRASGCSRWGAAFGGLWFTLSPYRTSQLCHLQMLLAAGVPLTLWLFHRLFARPGWGRALAFLAVYALQASGGNYLAYMLHVPLALVLLVHLRARWRELGQRRALLVLLPTAAAALACSAALFWPYLHAASSGPRGIGEWRAFGATTASYLTPGPFNWHMATPLGRLFRNESCLFAGLLVSALASLALLGPGGLLAGRMRPFLARFPRGWVLLSGALAVAGWAIADSHTVGWFAGSRWSLLDHHGYRLAGFVLLAAGIAAGLAWGRRRPADAVRAPLPLWEQGLLASTAVCAVLTFPLPYAVATHLLPGLDHMRVPSRFYTFVSLGLVWLAVRGWDRLAARLATRGRAGQAAAVLLALLATLEIFPAHPAWNPLPTAAEAPPVYAWLREQPEVRALVEVPFAEPFRELAAMYAQRFHGKPLVNGYSGYFPAGYQTLQDHFHPIPDAEALAQLRRDGVSHLLLHRTYHWRPPQRERIAAFVAQPGIVLAYDDGRDQVFVLARTAPQEPMPPP